MKNKTDIICILDKSGSMKKIKDDVIGGFNSFIESQSSIDGEMDLSLVLFDHLYEVVYSNLPITEVSLLNDNTFVPRGTTALFDAIGKTIDDVGIRLYNTAEEERPNKVMIVIITDGKDNKSKKYNQERITEMIQHQTDKYNWDFVFLASNQDAMVGAEKIAIAKGNTLNFSSSSQSVSMAFSNLDKMSASYRRSSKLNKIQLFESTDQDVRDINDNSRHK